MRYLIKISLFLSVSFIFVSCGGRGPKLEGISSSQLDSVSYAVGRSLGQVVKNANLGGDLNYKELVKGIRDVVEESVEPYDRESYEREVERYLQKREDFMASVRKQEADEFFEKNGLKPDVYALESGLQYSVIESPGDLLVTDRDTVTLYYEASLIDGTMIGSNFGKEPLKLAMSDMIEGWREGLKLINEGGRLKIWVPSHMAYGERGFGAIPPNSAVAYELEIVSVISPEEEEELEIGDEDQESPVRERRGIRDSELRVLE